MQYVKAHPIQDAREFSGAQTGEYPAIANGAGPNAFLNQAIRVLPGLAFTDKVPLPGYGTITLASAAAAIKAIYESNLNERLGRLRGARRLPEAACRAEDHPAGQLPRAEVRAR